MLGNIKFLFLAFSFIAIIECSAQNVTLNSPIAGGTKLPSASDYATEVLGNAWDFDSASDLANYVSAADFSSPIFSVNGGLLLAPAGGYFYMLSPGFCPTNPLGKNGQNFPIDTTKYRYLTIRMYNESSSFLKVLVNTSCNYFENFWQSNSIPTQAGWNTYVIDMQTVGRSLFVGSNPAWTSVPATGLRIDPSISGSPVLIDWITLTSSPPVATHQLSYSAPNPAKPYSIFLDDDANPSNGYVKRLVSAQDGTPTINIDSSGLFPASYNITAVASHDFASSLAIPWDMTSASDVSSIVNIQSPSFGPSGLSGTTQSGNYLFPNFSSALAPASQFRYLSIDLTTSQAIGFGVYYYGSSGNLLNPSPVTFLSSSGRHTYTADLGLNGSWSGNISAIQLAFFVAGTSFTLHSISLRDDGFGGVENAPISQSPGPLIVNSPPIINILQPDAEGGLDFASSVLNNPWNMDDVSDIITTFNQVNPQILPNNSIYNVQGDYFTGTSINNNLDPYQLSLNERTNSARQIDANRFKNIVFRLKIDRPQDINLGSVVRIVFRRASDPELNFFNGDDIITFDGFNTYVQDMDKHILEPLSHPVGTYPADPWSGFIDLLRVDAHEFSTATTSYYDFIRVTADDESNTKFALTFNAVDSDNLPSSVNVSFYYAATEQGVGTLIGDTTLADGNSIYWDTTLIPDGKYYIYAIADDGLNSYRKNASGAIVINHSLTQDLTPPVLSISNPIDNSTLYNTVTVTGYSLDNVQLAGINVLVDGTFLSKITNGNFDPLARALHPNFAESSSAGIRSVVSLADISDGAHTIQFIAFDTAGNESSSAVYSFTKTSGNDPSPPPTPTPYNAPSISVPIGGQTTQPKSVSLRTSVSLARNKLTLTVTSTASCNTVNLYGSPTSRITSPSLKNILIKSFAAGSKKVFSSTKVRPFRPLRGKSTAYFFAECDDQTTRSSLRSVATNGFRGTKITKLASWYKNLKSVLK